MKNKAPLLSICIPTYNRSHILKEVLQMYIENPEFDADVELIISDNCSTDDTKDVCQEFVKRNSQIRYYRNNQNINDLNFIKVLDYAEGKYLKLTNDWAYFDKNGLAFIKKVVKSRAGDGRPIFFTDNVIFTKRKAEFIECHNLDDYIASVSTYVTYNNIFGVWKEQWDEIDNKSLFSTYKLQQVDWTYQLVTKFGGCLIYDKKVLRSTVAKRKILSGYNWFEVHLENYYRIMDQYINRGFISKKTLKEDRHYLLEHFKMELCYTYFYNYNKSWRFVTKGTTCYLMKYYKKDLYFYLFMIKLPFFYIFHVFRGILRRLNIYK